MAYATWQDVQKRYPDHALDESEQAFVTVLLDDVELMIKGQIPDLDAKVTDGTIDEDALVMVESNAVVRILRNPDGFRQESEGNYSYSLDTRVAAGFLTLLDWEWALLGVTTGAFTITPYINPNPFPARCAEEALWSPW